MVTLPDGTKIRARRVNDLPSQDEPEFIEWGFAGLAREASRRSLGGSGPPSLATTPTASEHKGLAAYMEAEQEEEDDGSGMAWVRRRRREREARARMEREEAEKAAAAAAQNEQKATSERGNVSSAAAQVQDASATAVPASAPETVTAADAAAAATTSTAITHSTPTPVLASADEPMPLSADTHSTAQIDTADVLSDEGTRRPSLASIDTSRAATGTLADSVLLVASPLPKSRPLQASKHLCCPKPISATQ